MDEGVTLEEESSASTQWTICSEKIPKGEIVFFAQVLLVYIVTLTCIINLTLGNDPKELWVSLLASCIGYILPAPNLQV